MRLTRFRETSYVHAIPNSVNLERELLHIGDLLSLTHQKSKLKLQVISIPKPGARSRILFPTFAFHLKPSIGEEFCATIVSPLQRPRAEPLPLWVDDPGFHRVHQQQGNSCEQADKP